jgi:glutamate dehydrogenase
MLGKIPAARLALIEKIVRNAPRRLPAQSRTLARDFLRAFFRGVAEEDLRAHHPSDLARAALAHLELGRERSGNRVLVELAGPLDADSPGAAHRAIVRLVAPDMPFLVESVGIVFSEMNIAAHLIVHPVLDVRRDARGRLKAIVGKDADSKPESWQLMEIDRPRDAAQAKELLARLNRALDDVRKAVSDFRPMLERVRAVANELESGVLPVPKSHAAEARALLSWMHDGHFVFLGYRYYRLRRGRARDALIRDVDSGLGILRKSAANPAPIVLTGHLRRQARTPDLLVLTKANSASTVHRSSYLDYVGVKTFDAAGNVTGEHRFLGLWTSSAYHHSPAEIPLLRRKLDAVIEHFGLPPQSHDAKAVVNVIETFPRDELFQTPTAELIPIVRGIVNLYERRRVRLFVRRDSYERFYSCLVYVPRDRYNTEVRERIERIVRARFGGAQVDSQVQISDSTLARLHLLVHTPQGAPAVDDVSAIEAEIAAAAATWEDRLQQSLVERGVARDAIELANRYARQFPAAYRAEVEPAQALADIADLEALAANPAMPQLNLRQHAGSPPNQVHLRIVRSGGLIPISDILPMLENFGLRVLAEHNYAIGEGSPDVVIQDFVLEARDVRRADFTALEPLFIEAFLAAGRGDIENDGFNRLLLCAGLGAREIVVLRAYCRYLLQTGIPFSQAYMERVAVAQAPIARMLVRLFQTQFAPDVRARAPAAERMRQSILRALDKVASLDEDRILRAYLSVIHATLRTNYYQSLEGRVLPQGTPKSWISFKFDAQSIPELPLPRPRFEIFVYSPRVEGVHLRMGYVARGGIRWSDRREDFRTEVLGLMKAQNVKNTVIVPVGAKGGFYPKRLPAGGTREDIQKEGIASYQTFIRGLLDITDNIVNGKTLVRPGIVRRDGDDAYLVVAADKGTATFSDIANAISIEYGHWLGDAFASGGSAGYDHKGMGITARGAWECVKRHFRELGVDTQSQDFTVAGIGDMSGDVFGNGMLLSRHIRLVAAFDHRHIFIDPSPDAAASFRERERLFKLPRSSWDDYSRKLISRGGGVWSRSLKSIPLSAEARALLGLDADTATPVEVLRAILRMPVDLLWNGGIGTYVKAHDESNAEARDRANDAIRADGRELRAKVVGEGGNLGTTQRGRVEYAQHGGRINTDFIDNSAGVNTSDLEVNIKILLSDIERKGRLTRAARDKLLASMTGEVASLVLRNNYLQSQSLSVLEQRAPERLTEYQSLIRTLERGGYLDRSIEFLPADDEFLERRKQRLGLTRPELAVVLAYSKIWLSNHLLDSDLPDDRYFASEVQRYFPGPMRKRYSREIPRHRLKREIVATATTNSLVNRMGPVFVTRAQEDTGADPAVIARAYTIAREVFAMRGLWLDIEALDNRVPAKVQYGMFFRTSRLLRHASYWLLRNRDRQLSIDAAVRELRVGVQALDACIDVTMTGGARLQHDTTLAELTAEGVPEKLARRVARLALMESALDIVALARSEGARVDEVARTYFGLGVTLGLDWLHTEVDRLTVDGSWQATARTGLRDAAMRAHRELTQQVLRTQGKRSDERLARWSASRGDSLTGWQRTLAEMRSVGSADFATLTVGVDAVRGLAAA